MAVGYYFPDSFWSGAYHVRDYWNTSGALTVDNLPANPLFTVSPRITQLYDQLLPTKVRALSLKQGRVVVISVQLLNDDGNPVDLTPYGLSTSYPDSNVRARYREAVGLAACGCVTEDVGEILNVQQGIVAFNVPQAVTLVPAVYICEFAILTPMGMVISNELYVMIEPGLFGSTEVCSTPARSGPPTMAELRLHMRDSAPEENRLLDEYEFDVADVCGSLVRCVLFWNQSQPPINELHDTSNYPYRYWWVQGAAGQLMEMAAKRYLRNDLEYQAGGISVDDQRKWEQYGALGRANWEDYQKWVHARKTQLNVESGFLSLGSAYGYHISR